MRLRCGCGAVGRGGAGLPAVHGAVCLAAHDTSCAGGCCRRGTVPFATRKKNPATAANGCRISAPLPDAFARPFGICSGGGQCGLSAFVLPFRPALRRRGRCGRLLFCRAVRLCVAARRLAGCCAAALPGFVPPECGGTATRRSVTSVRAPGGCCRRWHPRP